MLQPGQGAGKAAGQHPDPIAACARAEGESPGAVWPQGQGQEQPLRFTTTAPSASTADPSSPGPGHPESTLLWRGKNS